MEVTAQHIVVNEPEQEQNLYPAKIFVITTAENVYGELGVPGHEE